MNILLSCAGRRNYLIQYFKEALEDRGLVFAADASEYASSLHEADGTFVVPTVDKPEYINVLLNLCTQYNIELLIPLNDLELPILAKNADSFKALGTLPVVSSPEVIDLCFDKWQTVEFAKRLGLGAPQTYLLTNDFYSGEQNREIEFPTVVKPRWGSASVGIHYSNNREELELAYQLLKRQTAENNNSNSSDNTVIIQAKINGDEYGLDIINDLQGNYVTTFVKKKLGMRAGETDRAITVVDNSLENIGETIGKTLGHIGNLDCDIMLDGNSAYLIEMNPRFGGGYPFSHAAGANIPAAIIAWHKGTLINKNWLEIEQDVCSAKCDRLVTKVLSPSREASIL